MDDWAAKDQNFAAMIGWTDEPLPFTDTFAQIWSLSYAHGTLYAGSKPANLLASENGGKDSRRIQALTDHPSAGSWNPGAAGLVLHTIVSDPGNPKKLWVGISAAGVFATEDGGATWERRRLSNADACVHHDHLPRPRWRHRALCPQHDACAGHKRRALPAEPPWCMAFARWRPKLGRHNQGLALYLRLSDPRPSARSEYHLDGATQRRHGGTFSARRSRSSLAVSRQRPKLAGDAPRSAAGGLLLHRAPSSDGGRRPRSSGNRLRHKQWLSLREL